jgi:hypothetical protein
MRFVRNKAIKFQAMTENFLWPFRRSCCVVRGIFFYEIILKINKTCKNEQQ